MDVFAAIASLAVGSAVPLAGYLAHLAIIAFEARTHIQLTENLRQTIQDSAKTAAGEIVVAITKGHAAIAEVSSTSPVVADHARAAVNAVSAAAETLGVTRQDMQRLVVGQVGALIAADPATPLIAPPAPAITRAGDDLMNQNVVELKP